MTPALILAMKEARITALTAKIALLNAKLDLERAERWKWANIEQVRAQTEYLDEVYDVALVEFYAAREAAGEPDEPTP